jgi:hypothetical protein
MVAVNQLQRAEEMQGGAPGFDSIQVVMDRLALLEAEVGRLRNALAILQDLERYRDALPLTAAGDGVALHSACVLDALDFVQAGAGFHQLEYSPSGLPYRWTGPGPSAHLTFWLDRTRPILVRIAVHSFGATGEETPIQIDVDGEPFLAPREPGMLGLLAGPVPPRDTPGPTHVTIHAPQVFSPARAGGSDTRLLGLALSRIELLPA